jgi:hypothetical protein
MVTNLGFPREESSLALKICKNDLEEAAELIIMGNDLPTLQAMAASVAVD